jgi:hypothetical protein
MFFLSFFQILIFLVVMVDAKSSEEPKSKVDVKSNKQP